MGVRRRGPRLTRVAPRPLASLALAATLLLVGTAPGCGLTQQEEARLSLHQKNSQEFYTRGSYEQARQQAEMALTFDDDLVGMRLMRGFCLVKMGKARGDIGQLDDAIETFEDLVSGHGNTDYRIWLGAGQAHLARALENEAEAGRIGRRLGGDFLSPESRSLEEQDLADERAEQQRHLERAERTLSRVLTFDLQTDNTYALIDLVLVLNSLGDRDTDAVSLARRAIELLVQSNDLTNDAIQNNVNIAPAAKLTLQRRIEENLAKERQLRDIVATIEYNRGALQAALAELDTLEERQLITAAQYFNRAAIHEQLGMHDEAIADFETYLRLRARSVEYDETASSIYDRIESLRSRGASARHP